MKLAELIGTIEESLKTRRDLTWTTHSTDGETADFQDEAGNQWRIMVEWNYLNIKNSVPAFRNKHIGFFSFLFLDPKNKKYTQDTINMLGTKSLSIIGIVQNALIERFNSHYDIMWFAAKSEISPTNFPSRVRLYNNLFSRFIHLTGANHYTLDKTKNVYYVVSKEPIEKEIEYIEQNFQI